MNYCQVCYANYEAGNSFTLECGHHTCINCFSHWAVQQINSLDYNIGNGVRCIAGCEKRSNIDLICNKLPQEKREQVHEALLGAYLRKGEDIRKCPSNKCDYAGIIDFKAKCSDKLECMKCGEQWLDKSQVSQTTKAKSMSSEFKSQLWEVVFTKSCPSCKMRIQKNGGCKHMNCTKCGYHFCWYCNQYFYNHSPIVCSIAVMIRVSIIAFIIGLLLYYLGVLGLIARGFKWFFGWIYAIICFIFKYGSYAFVLKVAFEITRIPRMIAPTFFRIIVCLGLFYYYGYDYMFKFGLILLSLITLRWMIKLTKKSFGKIMTQIGGIRLCGRRTTVQKPSKNTSSTTTNSRNEKPKKNISFPTNKSKHEKLYEKAVPLTNKTQKFNRMGKRRC